MIHHHEVVKHPNGGYAIVPCKDGEAAPEATNRLRKFRNRHEALEYANKFANIHGATYSAEVREEMRTR